jgi:hypothetical protein
MKYSPTSEDAKKTTAVIMSRIKDGCESEREKPRFNAGIYVMLADTYGRPFAWTRYRTTADSISTIEEDATVISCAYLLSETISMTRKKRGTSSIIGNSSIIFHHTSI